VRAANHESYMFAAKGHLVASIFGKYGEALLQQNIALAKATVRPTR